MKSKTWKNCLIELKRIYNILFEIRDIQTVRSDFFDKKWISKSELERLFLYETEELAKMVIREQENYNFLLEGFNLSAEKNARIFESKAIEQKKNIKV